MGKIERSEARPDAPAHAGFPERRLPWNRAALVILLLSVLGWLLLAWGLSAWLS